MAKELKTINLKGKPYVLINERVKAFRENYPDYALLSEIVELTDKRCVIKASVLDPQGREIADGIAYEVEGTSNVNKSSFIENCETSAWGRALGNFGIGIDTSICSAEELILALEAQENYKETPEQIAQRKLEGAEVRMMTNEEFQAVVSSEQVEQIVDLIERTETDADKMLKYYNVNALKELSEEQAKDCLKKLRGKQK